MTTPLFAAMGRRSCRHRQYNGALLELAVREDSAAQERTRDGGLLRVMPCRPLRQRSRQRRYHWLATRTRSCKQVGVHLCGAANGADGRRKRTAQTDGDDPE